MPDFGVQLSALRLVQRYFGVVANHADWKTIDLKKTNDVFKCKHEVELQKYDVGFEC